MFSGLKIAFSESLTACPFAMVLLTVNKEPFSLPNQSPQTALKKSVVLKDISNSLFSRITPFTHTSSATSFGLVDELLSCKSPQVIFAATLLEPTFLPLSPQSLKTAKPELSKLSTIISTIYFV